MGTCPRLHSYGVNLRSISKTDKTGERNGKCNSEQPREEAARELAFEC